MGKLIDKLERLQKTEGPRIGFGASNAAPAPSVAIVALLPKVDQKIAEAAVNSGADCLLVRETSGEDALAKTLGVEPSVPCGGEVSNPNQTSGNGWDFAVLTATDPIESLLKASDLDHALRLNTEIPEPVLQSLESLPVEAILLPEPKGDLTIEILMPYYRVAQSTSKPVLAELSQGNESAIMALRDAGIVGIIITADSVSKAKTLNIAKQAISTLPPKRAKRRSQKPAASLGLTPGPISRDDDDDD